MHIWLNTDQPGITGLPQISGNLGETETIDKMEKCVELNLAYINKWSLLLEIKILIKTPFTLLSKTHLLSMLHW